MNGRVTRKMRFGRETPRTLAASLDFAVLNPHFRLPDGSMAAVLTTI